MKYLLVLYLIGVSLFAQDVEVKRIALTFDDGPKIKVTEQILNVLKENEIKGTFFIVGVNGKRFPEILNKIYEEGHQIANHSYNHPNLRKISMENVKKELNDTNLIISSVTGEDVKYFRPPYGSLGKSQKEELKKNMGMISVMWNVCPQDWEKKYDADQIAKFLVENAKDRGVVLLHDYSKTADALKVAIPILKEKGYEFVTVEELYKK
ncbi:MAG: polysaccharide deacetylase family protein [Cetobacterium sp.]